MNDTNDGSQTKTTLSRAQSLANYLLENELPDDIFIGAYNLSAGLMTGTWSAIMSDGDVPYIRADIADKRIAELEDALRKYSDNWKAYQIAMKYVDAIDESSRIATAEIGDELKAKIMVRDKRIAELEAALDDSIADVENRGALLRRVLDALGTMTTDVLGRDHMAGYAYRDELMDKIVLILTVEELS